MKIVLLSEIGIHHLEIICIRKVLCSLSLFRHIRVWNSAVKRKTNMRQVKFLIPVIFSLGELTAGTDG